MLEKKVVIGTIAYDALTAPYLALFKQSLAEQTYKNFTLVIHNNTENNLGFSQAYNLMIKQAREASADYFLVINPDVYLAKNVLELLVKELASNKKLAVTMPKLLKWDFANKILTKIIDSCGLKLSGGLSFNDLGQGQVDHNQFDHEVVIGATGAAALFRLSALEEVKEGQQYFDEHFFMYKEDCDLAYRLYLKNYQALLVPEALAYHDRTASGGNLIKRFFNRRQRNEKVKQWSFINQHFLFIKYWHQQNLVNRFMILVRAKLMFLNALIFEQFLLSCYKEILQQRKTLKRY
jgi:GT2 family glycosyltransferase